MREPGSACCFCEGFAIVRVAVTSKLSAEVLTSSRKEWPARIQEWQGQAQRLILQLKLIVDEALKPQVLWMLKQTDHSNCRYPSIV